MFGAAIGDAVGSIYEHNPIKTKQFDFIINDFTDDTVCTVAVAKALIEAKGDIDKVSSLCIKYLQEFGLKYPDAGYGARFFEWLGEEMPAPYNSYGNGSAMRVSACGWLANNLTKAEKLAEITSLVTHSHPEGIKGAKAVAAAIFMARKGKSKEEIKKYIEDNYYVLNETLDEIRPDYDFDVTCRGSVPQSIEAFLESESFEDAVRNAVSLGGDSDTMGAIAGSIAEAYYGIPKFYLNDIKRVLPQEFVRVLEKIK